MGCAGPRVSSSLITYSGRRTIDQELPNVIFERRFRRHISSSRPKLPTLSLISCAPVTKPIGTLTRYEATINEITRDDDVTKR